MMRLEPVIISPGASLHARMPENISHVIGLVKNHLFFSFFFFLLSALDPVAGGRRHRGSLANVRSGEQEVASRMAHATLTCRNATSMLFVAALGTRRRPLSHQPPQKASSCACKRRPQRETGAVYKVKTSSSTNQRRCGICADVSCFGSTGDQAKKI